MESKGRLEFIFWTDQEAYEILSVPVSENASYILTITTGPQALTMQEIDHFVADVEIVRRAYEERKVLAEKD